MAYCRSAYCPDFGVAGVINALLQSEGVEVRDTALGSHVSIAGADQGYFIEVMNAQVDDAVRLLADNDFSHFLLTASDRF
jgi:hypothetical protein